MRIKQIEDNFMAAGEEAKSDNGAEKNKKYAEQKAKAAAFFNERGASGKDLTRYRKPANTDILYGRDFDDEVTAIEQIESPIGEVVINGMIRRNKRDKKRKNYIIYRCYRFYRQHCSENVCKK